MKCRKVSWVTSAAAAWEPQIEQREPVHSVLVPAIERHERRFVALLHAGEEGVLGLGILGGHRHE